VYVVVNKCVPSVHNNVHSHTHHTYLHLSTDWNSIPNLLCLNNNCWRILWNPMMHLSCIVHCRCYRTCTTRTNCTEKCNPSMWSVTAECGTSVCGSSFGVSLSNNTQKKAQRCLTQLHTHTSASHILHTIFTHTIWPSQLLSWRCARTLHTRWHHTGSITWGTSSTAHCAATVNKNCQCQWPEPQPTAASFSGTAGNNHHHRAPLAAPGNELRELRMQVLGKSLLSSDTSSEAPKKILENILRTVRTHWQ
jgi:hypothetical protein